MNDSEAGVLRVGLGRGSRVRRRRRARHGAPHTGRQGDELVDEAIDVGHGRPDPLVVHAKMLRLELLKVKADLERELEDFVLNCSKCGLDVHWVSGLGVTPRHWAHREPAPHGGPGCGCWISIEQA